MKGKKKLINPIIEVLLTIALLAVMVIGLSRLVENKSGYKKYNEFYKYNDEYEVLFFGSSHMMNAVLPMELWKKYGIKSYNIGNGAETIPVTYHVIRNALDYSEPKIIVMDLFYAYSDRLPTEISKELPHPFFDMVPLSKNKKEAIYDLFDDEQDRWSYLFDFSIYHSRWNELTKEDFYYADDGLGGASILLTSYAPKAADQDLQEPHDMASKPKAYLKKIKELCDERGIRLICVMNPYALWQESMTCNINFEKEMSELGIEFIDLRDSGIVDIYADSADNMHINLCGERKVNDFYGEYLTETGLLSTSPSVTEDKWNERYAVYIQRKADALSACEDCESLLTDLNDPDFVFDITLRSEAKLTDTMKRMLDNAEAFENVSVITDDDADEDITIRIRDKDSDRYFIERSYEP
ncbi:MAG: hypothetical protein IJT96_00300 [Lachnospiraceae bacterium]|nr:hypothetical protein [Lachnospiraceae bacterium]